MLPGQGRTVALVVKCQEPGFRFLKAVGLWSPCPSEGMKEYCLHLEQQFLTPLGLPIR